MTDQMFAVENAPSKSRVPASANPIWTYEETVVLLDLYLRVGRAEDDNAAVVETSRLLRRLGQMRGIEIGDTYRNAKGVSMKLKAMGQQDPEWRRLGLKGLRAVQMDAKVWADLASDPVALAARKAEILDALESPRSASDLPPVQPGQRRAQPASGSMSSHGPAPTFGAFGGVRQDGDALLYLLRLDGPAAALFEPGRLQPSMIVAKIGRSQDVARRIGQLSAGFPPASALRWTVVDTVQFTSAIEAHRVERAILDETDARGWSLGGEFLMAPEAELLQLIREKQNRAKTAL